MALAQKIDKRELLEAVKKAEIPVGAMYLSGILKVPQATVGRALRQMEEDGLLIQVGNKGRVLTDKGIAYIEKLETLYRKRLAASNLLDIVGSEKKEKLLDTLQARKILEVYTAVNASMRATRKDIEQLDANMLEYIRRIRHGGSGKEQDLNIHLLIAKIAGNSVVYQMVKMTLTDDDAYARFSSAADKMGNGNICINQHEAIIQAIKDHDSTKAGEAMGLHIDKVIRDVESVDLTT